MQPKVHPSSGVGKSEPIEDQNCGWKQKPFRIPKKRKKKENLIHVAVNLAINLFEKVNLAINLFEKVNLAINLFETAEQNQ